MQLANQRYRIGIEFRGSRDNFLCQVYLGYPLITLMKFSLCIVRKVPWRRKWQPPPVFSPREYHGQRSLVGYSPWGRKKLDMTEQIHSFWLSFFKIFFLKVS